MLCEILALLAVEHAIGDDEVDRACGERLPGVGGRSDREDVVPLLAEILDEQVAHGGIVLDHQDAGHRAHVAGPGDTKRHKPLPIATH